MILENDTLCGLPRRLQPTDRESYTSLRNYVFKNSNEARKANQLLNDSPYQCHQPINFLTGHWSIYSNIVVGWKSWCWWEIGRVKKNLKALSRQTVDIVAMLAHGASSSPKSVRYRRRGVDQDFESQIGPNGKEISSRAASRGITSEIPI